ncbi:MAG: DUF2493 domain-containing protein [Gammaproteobacteria bacterium]
MRVLACGGRDFADWALLCAELDALHAQTPFTCLIHGAAQGADEMAAKWANGKGIHVLAFPADWENLRRAAGPIRNKQMLDEGKPNLVVAFPGGRGTANMVRQALAAGLTVRKIAP